jgi:HSP90 family molecular chaperone
MTSDTGAETKPFQAEVTQLLHLMVHSVYSETDIFLRELISNASDACDKLRYEAIANPDLVGDLPPKISIAPDKKANTLTMTDTGIGMDRQELIDNLGTIARSGTRAFLDKLGEAKDGNNLIGQFGVGFYSAFMVADRIVVTSRRAGGAEAWVWSSDGGAGFDIAHADEAQAARVTRGTEIVLHLISRDLRDRAHRRRLFRQHPVSDRAQARGRRATPDQFGECTLAAAEVRAEGGGLRRGLPVHHRRLRRAGADAALPRRGPAILCGAAVRAVDETI